MNHAAVILLAGCLLSACAGRSLPDQPPIEVGSVRDLLAANPMPEGANIHSVLVSRGTASSRHLVQIRGRESPHLHAEHDLVVFILRGRGVLHLENIQRDMEEGSIAVVDRGIPHWFENTGAEPAAAFVVFAPPYDGSDNVPVDMP